MLNSKAWNRKAFGLHRTLVKGWKENKQSKIKKRKILMPKVGNKKYAYTPAGMKAAKKAAKKKADKKKKKSKSYKM
jgi:hypothetical protein